MNEGICRLCLNCEQLIESHIIPAWVFRFLYPDNGDNRPLELISSQLEHPKRRPNGTYDKKILCSKCDGYLGIFDDYGKEIILNRQPDPLFNSNVAFEMKDINYGKFKLFILSVLWRASISKIDEYSKINLGPFEEVLRKHILDGDPGEEENFSVIVSKFNKGALPSSVADKNIHMPYKIKMDGLNFSVFYFPNGYKIYIKVDRRNIQTMFEKIILKRNLPLVILSAGEFGESKEFGAMVKELNRTWNKS